MCDLMKKKLFILLIILILFSTITAISAEGNDTAVEDTKTDCEIISKDTVGYESFTTDIDFKLTSNNTALPSKEVSIDLNGKTYKKTTNSKGSATISVKLNKGTYNVKFSYAGDNYTNPVNFTTKLTIKEAQKTSLKVGDKDINYRQGLKSLFYVKLTDSKGKVIKNQIVTIKVNGKTYNVKTNKYGNAKIFLNLKKGTYKIKYSFKKTSPYLSSSGSVKIKVKSKMAKGNGYWLWSSHMKKVNLKSLSKKGTKHILLHVHAIAQYGKSSVVSFIKKAHKYGLKVHLWMQICYTNGKWVSPVKKNHKIKYGFLKSKIAEAKRYAKIKGVDGVHFDYIRFGGTAHKYKTATDAVNYFIKKASTQIHKIKPNCIVSAAVMPEPKMMLYYYGQDIPTMSRYLDSIIPMVYKGNYGKTTSWVKSVTNTFVKESNAAQLWTGLQTYNSESNAHKLSHKTLLKDAKSAMSGGATGVMLFRIGISCNFNFKKL